ncbi:MAG: PP2C family serine/threonine-protein phosphatase [Herbaspirillum sp.]
MTWRVVSASEVGTSHITSGKPCEDSCWALSGETATKMPVLSLFVADGAGSASHGRDGAELAMQSAAAFVAQKLAQPEFALDDSFAVECVVAVRERIYGKAESAGLMARDFACTFLGLVSTPQAALVMQVGDGGVVVDVGHGLEVAVVPMAGEYANMTHFVTDENAIEVLATKQYAAGVSRVAAFSDGIQRLALNMLDATPHEPFFSPFFRVLRASTDQQEDELQAALVRFLGSPAVNERTDDDKTLVLAVAKS